MSRGQYATLIAAAGAVFFVALFFGLKANEPEEKDWSYVTTVTKSQAQVCIDDLTLLLSDTTWSDSLNPFFLEYGSASPESEFFVRAHSTFESGAYVYGADQATANAVGILVDGCNSLYPGS